MSQVPAATRTLRVLRFLASQPDPVPLERLATRAGPAALDGLPPGQRDDRAGLRHPHRRGPALLPRRGRLRGRHRLRPPGPAPADRAPAAGGARGPDRAVGAPRGAARSRRPLRARGAGPGPGAAGDRCRRTAAGAPDRERPGDHGRACPTARCGPSTPTAARSWTGTAAGPQSLKALRSVLSETRRRGYATEDGEVTPGFASIAAAVLDHNGMPLGGIATTYDAREDVDLAAPGRGGVHHRAHRQPPPGPGVDGPGRSASLEAATT